MRVQVKNYQIMMVINVLITTALFLYAQNNFPMDYSSFFISAVVTLFCAASLFSLSEIALSKWNLAAVVMVVFILYVVNEFVRKMSLQVGDADYGIANTTFFGHSLTAPLILTLSVLFIGLILGWTNTINWKKTPDPKTTHVHSFKFWNITHSSQIFLVFVYCFIAAVYVSSIVRNQIRSFGSNISFDILNFATWQKFHDSGLDAMKDFWYPYGGMIWFQDNNIGPILLFITTFTLLTCFLYPVIKSQGISLYQVTILICLNYLVSVDWFNAVRYAFPFVSILIFIKDSHTRIVRIMLSIPISLVWWLSHEVALLCLLVLMMEFIRNRFFEGKINTNWREILEKFFLPLLSLILYILYSFFNGSLINTYNFLSRPLEASQLVSSIDFGIGTGNLYYMWSNFFLQLVLIGILLSFIKSVVDSRFYLQRPIIVNVSIQSSFALTLFISYFLLKDSTRSGMLTPSLFCILLFVLFEFSHKRINLLQKQILVSAMTSVLLLGSILQPSIQGLTQLNVNIKNVFFSPIQTRSNEPTKIDPEVSLAIQISGDQRLNDNIFVLGDRSTFYWGTSSFKYWTISNWSTYSDQERLLRQLKLNAPTYIYVDRRDLTLTFDRVPTVLRNASIYRWVVENYSFRASLNEGDLLVKSPNNSSKIEWSYWNTVLGTKLDVGYLGNAFGIDSNCSEKIEIANECQVDLYVPTNLPNGEVFIECGKTVYNLSYLNQRGYLVIPKSRVWFWRDACKLR
jgi:hypothetical protein